VLGVYLCLPCCLLLDGLLLSLLRLFVDVGRLVGFGGLGGPAFGLKQIQLYSEYVHVLVVQQALGFLYMDSIHGQNYFSQL